MNFPPQSSFLYKGKWTPEMDTMLVDTLLRLKGETGWLLKEFPTYFLLTAGREIEKSESVVLNEIELLMRVEEMQNRYLTFKELVAQKGAHWDFSMKDVTAPEMAWEKICKKKPLAGAYYYAEEPLYSKLACLFGMYDIKLEDEKEVIVISESSDQISDDEPSCYEIDDTNTKVTSPLAKSNVYAQRQVVVDVEAPADRASSTEPGIYFINIGPDGKPRTKLERERVLPKVQRKPNPGVGPSKQSSFGSSCGSNTPIGGWPYLQ